jgi:catechol 2,3-dioxygenase-like lactoylglutathione lyase family enzyme
MPRFTCRFSQVILYVKDMAAEVHFYRDRLGLPISYPQGKSDYSKEMWVEFDTGDGCSLALHGGIADPPGIEHEVVFTVDNIMTAWLELEEAEVDIGQVRLLETNEPFATGRDPEGHRFSIRELRKE